jgi:sodium-dependent phosphate transporter
MAVLHQFDYIFAFGIIFAFLDAWNIGANDVANSFATSVSSRSLTLPQAMIIASFTEFLGALLVGYACPRLSLALAHILQNNDPLQSTR